MLSRTNHTRARRAPTHTERQVLTWGQRLLELLGLVTVRDAQREEVRGAANLKLGHAVGLLYLDGLGVLAPCRQEKVLDLVDLLRLQANTRQRRWSQ